MRDVQQIMAENVRYRQIIAHMRKHTKRAGTLLLSGAPESQVVSVLRRVLQEPDHGENQ